LTKSLWLQGFFVFWKRFENIFDESNKKNVDKVFGLW
jgi:hypothetical protein